MLPNVMILGVDPVLNPPEDVRMAVHRQDRAYNDHTSNPTSAYFLHNAVPTNLIA